LIWLAPRWLFHKNRQESRVFGKKTAGGEASGKLKGKVIIVTGGGRGIGQAIATHCAREGAHVGICARTASEVESTVTELQQIAPDAAGWACDVSDEEQVANFIRAAHAHFGRIDCLINNAGVMTRPVPITELEVRKFDYAIAVNLRGTFLMCKAVVPIMEKQRGGSIVNMSSMVGRGAYANFVGYAASKWGVEGLTTTLAAELRDEQIRVNSVEPGYVATKMTGYHGSKPKTVTDVFVYLASDESKSVTGKMLSSSGWKSQVR
jgi:NAD(P)-dependent dehydrogenase (short-subunit alcohol dehydrogenase family)